MTRRRKKGQPKSSAALTLPGSWTDTALSLPPDLAFEDWLDTMQQLHRLGSAYQWWIGDAIIFGEGAYGSRIWDAVAELYTPKSLTNIILVCRSIPPERRHPSLTFNHHVVVYALSEQQQEFWLSEAEKTGWPVREFRRLAHGSKTDQGNRKFGAPLNFRQFRNEPINEQGVVFLFGMVARDLGFIVEAVTSGFPDCAAKRRTNQNYYENVNIEFQFKASNFRTHRHNPDRCDILVCWENDWPDCPLETIELKTEVRRLAVD